MQRYRAILTVENLGEAWRCRGFARAEEAREALQEGVWLLLTDDGMESRRLMMSLQERPVMQPPWVLPIERAEEAAYLSEREVPPLAQLQAKRIQPLAQGLLRALDVPPGMGAQVFLARMLARCTVCPVLMEDLRGRLYPLCGEECCLRAAAVERRLRLCVEACWTKGELRALERFIGRSVDPEKGKPTNREFLFRLQEHLFFAGRRIYG